MTIDQDLHKDLKSLNLTSDAMTAHRGEQKFPVLSSLDLSLYFADLFVFPHGSLAQMASLPTLCN